MRPILVAGIAAGVLAVATTASSQLLKAQPKGAAPAPAAAGKAPAAAAPASPRIIGTVGVATCAQWLTARQSPTGVVESNAWVGGFLSAMNFTGTDPTKNITLGAGPEAIAAALDQDCRARPADLVGNVMWQGMATLLRARGYDTATIDNRAPLPKLR